MKIRDLAAKYGMEIGCGDSSCRFGSPGGQHTNGGCRCWPRGISARNVSDEELTEMRELLRRLVLLLHKVIDDTKG